VFKRFFIHNLKIVKKETVVLFPFLSS